MEDNITLGLPNTIKLVHCPQCNFYLHLHKVWVKLQSESTLLLSFCSYKLRTNINSNNLRLPRSKFIPSESNSNSIKTMFYVQKEVTNGQTLEQSYVVEFLQDDRVCEPCSRVQVNPNQWLYSVRLRQHGSHARSFLYLEHVISKHGVAANAVRIQKMKHLTEFFFDEEACARKLVDFIKRHLPVWICEGKALVSHDKKTSEGKALVSHDKKTSEGKALVSHDKKTSEGKALVSHDKKTSNYCLRYTFFIHVCSICCEDLIFLPPNVASRYGNIGPIMICTQVSNIMTLFDPLTSKQYSLDGEMYWRVPFKSLLTCKDIVEYVVLNIHEVYFEFTMNSKTFGLANAEVARVKDLGKNDTRFNIKTHLGYLLKSGDHALGYDLWEANCSDSEIELKEHIGDGVILIKKKSEEKLCQKRRAEHRPYLKDLEEITNDVHGMSLGSEEQTLEEQLGDLNLSGEEYKVKKKARKMA